MTTETNNCDGKCAPDECVCPEVSEKKECKCYEECDCEKCWRGTPLTQKRNCDYSNCDCSCHSTPQPKEVEVSEWDKEFDSWSASLPMDNRSYEAILRKSDIPWLKSFIEKTLAAERARIAEQAKEELLVKCECEKGDCLNCSRLCGFIDSLTP
jgi:hypothetical protein